VACDHRVHSNILHYSHNTAAPGARKSNLDMRLLSGRRMDNQKYDRRGGRILRRHSGPAWMAHCLRTVIEVLYRCRGFT
jgi:hypothetical protein